MTDDTQLLVLASMISDATAAQGVDRFATEVGGFSAARWAELTDRAHSTVQRNVRRAQRAGSVPCSECGEGRLWVSDAICAVCDNCDAEPPRDAVGF